MDAPQRSLIGQFREFGRRWPYLNLCIMRSPLEERLSDAAGRDLPPLPEELLARALGKGSRGWRWPLVKTTSVWCGTRYPGDVRKGEARLRNGRVEQEISLVTADGQSLSVEWMCDYVVCYDLRGSSEDGQNLSLEADHALAAMDEFEAIVRAAMTSIDIRVERLVGFTEQGRFHDGQCIPPGLSDLVTWQYALFHDRPVEPILSEITARPWYVAILAPNLGEASATLVEVLVESRAETDQAEPTNANGERDLPPSSPKPHQPTYDKEKRELRVEEHVIRVYRRHPATNQITVLTAFQEADWPGRIDDPLPGRKSAPKRRLRDTIDGLNEGQTGPPFVRFKTDGTGEGVQWEIRQTDRD